jgi:hypothetical protein
MKSATGRNPDRALPILNHRGRPWRCAVGRHVAHDSTLMEADDASATADAHPEAAVRANECVNGANWKRGRRVRRLPGTESISVEAEQACRRPEPQVPFHVLGDRKHVSRRKSFLGRPDRHGITWGLQRGVRGSGFGIPGTAAHAAQVCADTTSVRAMAGIDLSRRADRSDKNSRSVMEARRRVIIASPPSRRQVTRSGETGSRGWVNEMSGPRRARESAKGSAP